MSMRIAFDDQIKIRRQLGDINLFIRWFRGDSAAAISNHLYNVDPSAMTSEQAEKAQLCCYKIQKSERLQNSFNYFVEIDDFLSRLSNYDYYWEKKEIADFRSHCYGIIEQIEEAKIVYDAVDSLIQILCLLKDPDEDRSISGYEETKRKEIDAKKAKKDFGDNLIGVIFAFFVVSLLILLFECIASLFGYVSPFPGSSSRMKL